MWWRKKIKLEYWTDEEMRIKGEEWLQHLIDGEDERKEKIKQNKIILLYQKIDRSTEEGDKEYWRLYYETEQLEDKQKSLERERETDEEKQKREDDFNIRNDRLMRENARRSKEMEDDRVSKLTIEDKNKIEDEKNKEKWKMRKDTLLTILVVLGIPFLLALCNPSSNSDPSNIKYDGRPVRGR